MIRLCNPDGSGLQSLVGSLYLPHQETRVRNIILLCYFKIIQKYTAISSRLCYFLILHLVFHLIAPSYHICSSYIQCTVYLQKEILDIIYEVFRLPIPKWTDDFAAALLSVGKYSL